MKIFYHRQRQYDNVLNGLREIKILKTAKSGLNPLINHMSSMYEKFLQKFSHALVAQCITKWENYYR